MKGIVFTEFLDMVEDKLGLEFVDDMINGCELPSGGVYTAVGTYDFNEMVSLVSWMSNKTGTSVPDLLNLYGKHMFKIFNAKYTSFFTEVDNAFDFLESIETYIHVEVKKLYPDAQLPTFETKREGEHQLEMIYRSERKMSDFALGLIEETLLYYETKGDISRTFLNDEGSEVKFIIVKK